MKKVRFYQLFFTPGPMAQPPMDQCVQFFVGCGEGVCPKALQILPESDEVTAVKKPIFWWWYSSCCIRFLSPLWPNFHNFFWYAGGGDKNLTKCASTAAEKPGKHYSWLCTLFKTLICPDDYRVVYDVVYHREQSSTTTNHGRSQSLFGMSWTGPAIQCNAQEKHINFFKEFRW